MRQDEIENCPFTLVDTMPICSSYFPPLFRTDVPSSQHSHEPMRSVNVFWGVSGERALTTCWSLVRSNCIVFCVPTSRISIGHGHIKGSTSRFRKGKFPPFH